MAEDDESDHQVNDHESSSELKTVQELAENTNLGLDITKRNEMFRMLLLLQEKQKVMKDIENDRIIKAMENQVRLNNYPDEPQPEASTSSSSSPKTRTPKGVKKQSDTFVARDRSVTDTTTEESKEMNNKKKRNKNVNKKN